jgi:hypothetical protein
MADITKEERPLTVLLRNLLWEAACALREEARKLDVTAPQDEEWEKAMKAAFEYNQSIQVFVRERLDEAVRMPASEKQLIGIITSDADDLVKYMKELHRIMEHSRQDAAWESREIPLMQSYFLSLADCAETGKEEFAVKAVRALFAVFEPASNADAHETYVLWIVQNMTTTSLDRRPTAEEFQQAQASLDKQMTGFLLILCLIGRLTAAAGFSPLR